MQSLIALPFSLALGTAVMLVAVRQAPRKFIRPNFQGRSIPASVGLTYVAAAAVYFTLEREWIYAAATVIFGGLGLIDDIYGDRTAGGLKGHFRALLGGRVTTGALKAIGGIAGAVACGWWIHSASPSAVLAAVLIAGTANSLNLVDLRPGRCLALFFAGCIPLILFAAPFVFHHSSQTALTPLGFTVVCAALLLIGERKAKYMLGDSGANSFGAALGLSYAVALPIGGQIVIAALILWLHTWTERNSISAAIAANPFLSRVDAKIGVR